MKEDYNAEVQELGDAMESSEIDCTKPDLTESCSGDPILQWKWTGLHQIATHLTFKMIFLKLLS